MIVQVSELTARMDIKLNKRVSLRPIQSDLACLSVAQIGPNPLGPAYCAIRGRFAFSKQPRPAFQPLRIRRPAFVAVDRHDGRRTSDSSWSCRMALMPTLRTMQLRLPPKSCATTKLAHEALLMQMPGLLSSLTVADWNNTQAWLATHRADAGALPASSHIVELLPV